MPSTIIVRLANRNGGPCNLLGPLLKELKLAVRYRCRRDLETYIPKRLVHLEPCPSCPDHSRSRFPHLKEHRNGREEIS